MTVMRASPEGKATTRRNEGYKTAAYTDTAAKPKWTIGVGHAETNPRPVRGLLNGAFYQGPPKEGVTITQSEVERLFAEDSAEVEEGLSRIFGDIPMSQGVFDALFDLGFQYGIPKLEHDAPHLHDALRFNSAGDKVIDNLVLWMRSGGVPQEALYRRRLRNACQCRNLPIPDFLWNEDDFPWGLDERREIDFDVTMPWSMVLAIAKNPAAAPEPKAPPPPKPTPSPPSSSEAAPDTVVVASESPDVAGAEVFRPAARVKGTQEIEHVEPDVLKEPPVSPFAQTDPPAKPLPTVTPIAGPPIQLPASAPAQAVQVAADGSVSIFSKSIEDSERVKGFVSQSVGRVVMRAGARGMFGSAFTAGFGAVESDPILYAALIATVCFAGVYAVGWVKKKFGDWRRERGESGALSFLH